MEAPGYPSQPITCIIMAHQKDEFYRPSKVDKFGQLNRSFTASQRTQNIQIHMSQAIYVFFDTIVTVTECWS